MIMMVFMSSFRAPTRTISGRVTAAEDGNGAPGVNVVEKGTRNGTVTNAEGNYKLTVSGNESVLVFSFIGFATTEVIVGQRAVVDVSMTLDVKQLTEVVVTGQGATLKGKIFGISSKASKRAAKDRMAMNESVGYAPQPEWNTEEYSTIHENIFHGVAQNPLSTFSIDVDAASYSNMRRFIQHGQRPPKDAVRIEEMVNYFDYNYPDPAGEDPFSIYTEMGIAPWNAKHRLVHIGLQGKRVPTDNLPPSNLVFLIDVSGSMADENKLPLLKASLRLLVDQLRPVDRLSMVVYAGAAGLVLPSTSGEKKREILAALDELEAGGSTAGGAGIQLAYSIAKQNFQTNGNNRVILATDGDFNVGESSDASMERLIEKKREDGIFLTVLGFGTGNYKDSKMETLADKGNGNYAYIDNILEAQKVLVNEFGGTLFTIAKDVKLQVEFNPTYVKAWRLVGYENRVLKNEDFNNDKKDAGDLGSGHSVTALYEIIPQGVESEFYKIDELKYQKQTTLKSAGQSDEWLTVKFRYKAPMGITSKLIVHPLKDDDRRSGASENFTWSAAVAGFGMLLRESEYVNAYRYEDVLLAAEQSRGSDKDGYRSEFVGLVKSVKLLSR
ncbi:MAG: von Willebrand factor type A domain-containing protein [Cyclobacteriaceae bacterium]|nr:von Willebrand factor type A domain-containing protein [Cyclobacteriaceae bacterium]